MAEFKPKIPDMSCGHCEKNIREAVSKAGGIVKSLDLKSKEVVVEIEAEADKLLYIIVEAGHDAGLI
ncbi:MAG: heavy-metal-associated domain-containing protein [Synergistaceae bacterium]|nr:heavy-metal-associated domain-containing protein [Synergistaceae bacterium]